MTRGERILAWLYTAVFLGVVVLAFICGHVRWW